MSNDEGGDKQFPKSNLITGAHACVNRNLSVNKRTLTTRPNTNALKTVSVNRTVLVESIVGH